MQAQTQIGNQKHTQSQNRIPQCRDRVAYLSIEIADLFDEAQELGYRKDAPHCLAEDGLDYVGDGSFEEYGGEEYALEPLAE